ncbi:hypothetical protein BDK51DRAFT_28873 [Blyttiomyces helicus]|uniref:Uncharacterized protein n=1 Tax=Blyttiomyces helicus TaxID=388810 RepID=A0A4P9WNF0_9FUNG|nr:hypothetical protein BDK51DRAFT_28873 [Blyttiomyces helicus]|eukprot:RKO93218.1 hypothetical protein BDK51DRAFT_28873 [Blyttiomyces helicus]
MKEDTIGIFRVGSWGYNLSSGKLLSGPSLGKLIQCMTLPPMTVSSCLAGTKQGTFDLKHWFFTGNGGVDNNVVVDRGNKKGNRGKEADYSHFGIRAGKVTPQDVARVFLLPVGCEISSKFNHMHISDLLLPDQAFRDEKPIAAAINEDLDKYAIGTRANPLLNWYAGSLAFWCQHSVYRTFGRLVLFCGTATFAKVLALPQDLLAEVSSLEGTSYQTQWLKDPRLDACIPAVKHAVFGVACWTLGLVLVNVRKFHLASSIVKDEVKIADFAINKSDVVELVAKLVDVFLRKLFLCSIEEHGHFHGKQVAGRRSFMVDVRLRACWRPQGHHFEELLHQPLGPCLCLSIKITAEEPTMCEVVHVVQVSHLNINFLRLLVFLFVSRTLAVAAAAVATSPPSGTGVATSVSAARSRVNCMLVIATASQRGRSGSLRRLIKEWIEEAGKFKLRSSFRVFFGVQGRNKRRLNWSRCHVKDR